MTSKIIGFGQTAWNHKKKIIFFSGLGAWGLSYLNKVNNEQILRTSYARKAESVGSTLIGNLPGGGNEYVPQKLHVFVDRSDTIYHKNLASFNKNVMPLLELAGFDVRIHNAENEEELRLLSKAADVRNCGGIVLLGSQKFAAPAVLDGLFVTGAGSKEARTSLAVFDPVDRDDVEKRCQKAMRIINGTRDGQHVYSTKVYTKSTEEEGEKAPETGVLRIADTNMGWFDFCKEKEPKFWWFGGLSNRIAFTWYFLKSYPQALPLQTRLTSQCKGCRRCVTEAAQDPNEQKQAQRWWQGWIGRREQPGDKKRRQFANVINEQCGKEEDLQLDSVDVVVCNLNEGEHGGFQIRTIDSFPSRWSAIWQIWSNWNNKTSPKNYFVDKSNAQRIEFQITGDLPDQIVGTKSVKNLNNTDDKISRIVLETLPNTVQVY
ncbi:hypothetical protein M3Y97_01075600 [Aphelenchoides bicaudatus]|nr:hypothetical protein M3Y97_01075600 [Aphelenchoides bicaudatus]